MAASSSSNIPPAGGNPKYTGDFTAFDALIRYADSQGRNGFVAFEIKYSESMREPMPELKPRHAELSDASGLFTDPTAAALRTNPLAQFWRETLLAQTMIDNGLYDEGYFVTIAPALNYHVQDAAETYQAQLREPEEGKVRFVNLTLEDVIETIRLSDTEHAEALHRRYCDFWLVDAELERNAPTFGLARPCTRTTVPSRMSLMIGSSFKECAFQSSQSPFTLRQTRLTVSFPTAPPNKAASARRTRRVLVPAKSAEAVQTLIMRAEIVVNVTRAGKKS